MGVSIDNLQDGCCKSFLEQFNIIITDESREDKSIKFVDYVLELESLFIFIEEKSFILSVIPPINGEINNEAIENFKKLSKIEKELKVCKSSFRLISDSNSKLKDTIIYLIYKKDYKNIEKIKKSAFIYLYCLSNDRRLRNAERILITTLNQKNRKNIFISCDKINDFIYKKEKNEQK